MENYSSINWRRFFQSVLEVISAFKDEIWIKLQKKKNHKKNKFYCERMCSDSL